jgi:hypothetical protein
MADEERQWRMHDLKDREPKDIKEFNSKTFKILCGNVAFDIPSDN